MPCSGTGSPLKLSPEWKAQQKIMWAQVREEIRRGKGRFKIRDLLANRRCSQAVLDFLSTTDVGRLSRLRKTHGARCLSGSTESGKRRGGRRQRSWVPWGGERGSLSFAPPFVIPVLRDRPHRDRPGWRAKGRLQRASCRLIEVGEVCTRHDLARSHANNELKKKVRLYCRGRGEFVSPGLSAVILAVEQW